MEGLALKKKKKKQEKNLCQKTPATGKTEVHIYKGVKAEDGKLTKTLGMN